MSDIEVTEIYVTRMRLISLISAASLLILAKELDFDVDKAQAAFAVSLAHLFEPAKCECRPPGETS